VFAPVGAALAGSIALVWYHPAASPAWLIGANLGLQILSHALTAALWGPWQARLSRDPAGSESVYLKCILASHGLRTAITTASALVLLVWAIELVGR
jgi:hypothetical protein